MTSRGIRNNNPGNLRYIPSIRWNGLDDPPQDDKGYCRFKDSFSGIRAMTLDLLDDFQNDSLDTVRKLISEYAPPSENDTEAYIAHVCAFIKKQDNEKLDLLYDIEQLTSLLCVIIKHENGEQPYTRFDVSYAAQAAQMYRRRRG